MDRGLAYLAVVFLALVALALGLMEFLFQTQVQPQLNAARALQTRHFDAYTNDLAYLDRFEILKPRKSGTADAGPYLNPRLAWSPLPSEVTDFRNPLVPTDLREEVLRLGSQWMEKHGKVERWKVDLSIFPALVRFDHWDIEQNSPITRLLESAEFVPPTSLPIPEPLDLMAASKLRLMKGALENRPLEALAEVRQLARLLLSSENMQLTLAGLSILDNERFAYRFYVDEKGLAPDAWETIDRNTTRRAHRALLATRDYLRIWTPEEFVRKVFLSSRPPFAVCPAINEAMPLAYSIRFMLEPHWPLEIIDFRDEYQRLDGILRDAMQVCRLHYLSTLAKENEFDVEVPGPWFMNHLPYARKVFGTRVSTANFVRLEGYDSERLVE